MKNKHSIQRMSNQAINPYQTRLDRSDKYARQKSNTVFSENMSSCWNDDGDSAFVDPHALKLPANFNS